MVKNGCRDAGVYSWREPSPGRKRCGLPTPADQRSAVVTWAAQRGPRRGTRLARKMARKPDMLIVVAHANRMADDLGARRARRSTRIPSSPEPRRPADTPAMRELEGRRKLRSKRRDREQPTLSEQPRRCTTIRTGTTANSFRGSHAEHVVGQAKLSRPAHRRHNHPVIRSRHRRHVDSGPLHTTLNRFDCKVCSGIREGRSDVSAAPPRQIDACQGSRRQFTPIGRGARRFAVVDAFSSAKLGYIVKQRAGGRCKTFGRSPECSSPASAG